MLSIYLATIGLLAGTTLAIITMVKCRNHWQLLVIALWKMSMSLFNGVVGFHVAKRVKDSDGETTFQAIWWIALCTSLLFFPRTDNSLFVLDITGMIPGFVGLVSLVVQHWSSQHSLKPLTYTFGGAIALTVFLTVLGLFHCIVIDDDQGGAIIFSGIFLLCCGVVMLPALYSDWALGVMSNNLTGLPSPDNAPLYWTYWLVKRFTMISP